jgi:mono/diheme cytochrome c family protein
MTYRSLAAAVLAAMLAGCGQSMWEQHKLTTYAPDPAFDDGASARPLVPGVVERGQQVGPRPETRPVPLTAAWLRRGQERFHIYCEVCHGALGNGRGILAQYGFPNPPSYTEARLMSAADGELFDVITHGKDKMYSYRDRVSPTDRWAIVAYIRALQLSQHATPEDLPPGVKLPGNSP